MAAHAPSFRYHATEAPTGRLFQTHDELDALSAEWVDTPAHFKQKKVKAAEPDPIVDALEPLRRKKHAER